MATRKNRAEWVEWNSAFERSGEPLSAFCARHRLKARTLSWWRWKLGAEKRSAVAPRFIELAVREPTTPAPRASAVELLCDGVLVRFESGTPAEYVAAVVSGIRAR